MKVLLTICARGGSKGIPGKNIRELNGKPLIDYTIQLCNKFKEDYRDTGIVLSTDSHEIIKVCENLGLKCNYTRPNFLATDTASKIDAIKDVLLWKEDIEGSRYDFIIDLDVTSPLRNLNDVISAFEIIKNNSEAVNIFSVSPANRNPYFNMVEQKDNGFFAQVKRLESPLHTRQSTPKVYDMNASFYIYKRSFFDFGYTSAVTDRSMIYVVPHLCFDLDHAIDFEIMEFLMSNNKLDFSL